MKFSALNTAVKLVFQKKSNFGCENFRNGKIRRKYPDFSTFCGRSALLARRLNLAQVNYSPLDAQENSLQDMYSGLCHRVQGMAVVGG